MSFNIYHLDLQSLIDGDYTSYEFYMTLSDSVQRKLRDLDIHTFTELQQAARKYSKQENNWQNSIE